MIDYKVEQIKKRLCKDINEKIYYLKNKKIIYDKKNDLEEVKKIELEINILYKELSNLNKLDNSNYIEFINNIEVCNTIYSFNDDDMFKIYNILREFDRFNTVDGKNIVDIRKEYKDICERLLFISKAYERVCFDMDLYSSNEFMILENNIYSNRITNMKYISNSMKVLFKNDIDLINKKMKNKEDKSIIFELQNKLYNDIKKHVKFMMVLFLEQDGTFYNINDSIDKLFELVNKIYISSVKEVDDKKRKYEGIFNVSNKLEDKKCKNLSVVNYEFVNYLKSNNIDLFQYSSEDFLDGVAKSNLYNEINMKKRIK